jgi:hypothetical protein
MFFFFLFMSMFTPFQQERITRVEGALYNSQPSTINRVHQDGVIYIYRCRGNSCDLIATVPDRSYVPPLPLDLR